MTYRTHGKLMLIICCVTHAVLAAVASAGPTPDVHQLAGVLRELPRSVTIERLVADAGFESAGNHRLLRDDHGIASTIPPNHGWPNKGPRALPADRWRRRMKTHFNQAAYRRRPQVETAFSMIKRNFGQVLQGHSYQSRRRDLLLLAVTHNVALPHGRVFYRAAPTPFQPWPCTLLDSINCTR